MMSNVIDISILDNFPTAVLLVDLNGNTKYVNVKFTEVFGHKLSEITNIKEWWTADGFDGHLSEQDELWSSLVNKLNSETFSVEYHLKRKNVKDIHIEYRKLKNSIFLNINDVTHVKQFSSKLGNNQSIDGIVENALQIINDDNNKNNDNKIALIESEERMSSIFDNAPVAMLLLNEKREVLQINKKGLLYLRKSKEESINLPFGDVYNCLISFNNEEGCGAGEQCKKCLIKKTVEDTFKTGKTHFKVDVSVNTLEGKRFFHLSTAQLNLNNRKEILASIDDITNRKSIELELKISKRQAEESDKLKTAFLQNMSHEIRTPLNGILGFLGLLNNNDISDEEKDFYFNVINESSNQLLSIVDNILSLSRLENEKMEVHSYEVNLNSIIEDLFLVYNTKAKEKDIFVKTYKGLSYNDSEVFSDSSKIQLILENLLNNAIKFTNEGYIKYGYYLEEDQIVFFVEDTGIGIEEIYFNKIFERFQQIDYDLNRKYGGTGLGLTIAKGNVELLGGKIWLKSKPNEGTTFYFSIPYKPVNESISIIKETTTKHTSDNIPVILVAEDEEINYIYIEEALKDEPIKIIHALDGREAVEYCKEFSEIRLVLMDIKMPHMDGYMAFSKIKEFRPELPIVAQTAYAFFADKKKALESGFNDYIAKPIKKELLVDIIHKYTKQTV